MVRIRLKRVGKKARPFYRIVAAPSTAGRDGRFVEQLGFYDPLKEPSLVNIDKERVLHWLKNGASSSDTLVRLLTREGIWQEFEASQPASKPKRKPVKARVRQEKAVKVKKRKPKPEPEAPAAEAAPAAPVEAPATEAVVQEAPAAEATPEEAPVEVAASTEE